MFTVAAATKAHADTGTLVEQILFPDRSEPVETISPQSGYGAGGSQLALPGASSSPGDNHRSPPADGVEPQPLPTTISECSRS